MLFFTFVLVTFAMFILIIDVLLASLMFVLCKKCNQDTQRTYVLVIIRYLLSLKGEKRKMMNAQKKNSFEGFETVHVYQEFIDWPLYPYGDYIFTKAGQNW